MVERSAGVLFRTVARGTTVISTQLSLVSMKASLGNGPVHPRPDPCPHNEPRELHYEETALRGLAADRGAVIAQVIKNKPC